jgi:dTDP-4-amino-4,6-dideoxygalactose transaminase
MDPFTKIPFNLPETVGLEFDYMREATERRHISGDGYFTRLCHAWLEKELGVHKALLTTSCTAALEMIGILLDIRPGDEVILPSFTFVSVANAFILRGAKPVFVDIRPNTLNIDDELIEGHITKRTKAIVAVHYAGVACEMDRLLVIGNKHGIPVIEDNAHGLFGNYHGRPLGSFGSFATQSFHETKNFTCGEGGALIINDPKYADRAEILWEKGTNRRKFFAGVTEKYTWVDVGSSFLPSELLAAFLFAQLSSRDRIQALRKAVWEYYFSELTARAARFKIDLPHVPAGCDSAYHLFFIILPAQEIRDQLIDWLRSVQIGSAFHYPPLHLSPMGRSFGYKEGDCPMTESVSVRLLRLPFYNSLSRTDQDRIISAICGFCETSQSQKMTKSKTEARTSNLTP